MQKIIIEGRRSFGSIKDADLFCADLDAADKEWYSCTADPFSGSAVVSWGYRVELTLEEDKADAYAQLGRALLKEDQQAAANFSKQCEIKGREDAARKLAQEAGYKGAAAQMFCAGFTGLSAKYVKPKNAGMEAEFRAGRIAWGSPEGQRTYRAACSEARRA